MPVLPAPTAVRRIAVLTAALVSAVMLTGPVSPASALPGPGTTGVRPGVVLRPSGPLRVTKAGAVLENLDVTGCVTVLAPGVTLRNVRIRCAGAVTAVATKIPTGGAGVVIEDSEIDGMGSTQVGVGYTNYTLRRVDVHDVSDGARFGHGVLIEDSWVHSLTRQGSLHGDAVQTTSASGSTIRRNVLSSLSAGGSDLNNSALMLGSETGTRKVVDVLIEDNVLSGGNFTVNVRSDITASGLVIRNNTFLPGSRYGQVLAPAQVPVGEGNVLGGSGLPITVVATR